MNASPDGQEAREAQAIEDARNGKAGGFEYLYGLHKRRVYSLCLRMTGNPAEAEDLTQEAFLQIFRKIGTFRAEAAFSTWVHRLTVNLVLMRLRKKNLPTTSLDDSGDSENPDARPREYGSSDMNLTGTVDRLALERAIGALPDGYKMIFHLHDVEGYEHKEIAEMVGCSIGNSKSQLHKARMKLRELLQMDRSEVAGAEES